jgi:hypothetical protein
LNELAKLTDCYGNEESLPKSVEELHKSLELLELMVSELSREVKQGPKIVEKDIVVPQIVEKEVVKIVEKESPRSSRPSIVVPRKSTAEIIVPQIQYQQVAVPQIQYQTYQLPEVVISAYELHRERMVSIIESNGHLEAIRMLFLQHAGHREGILTEGEIHNFIQACFLHHGLAPPDEAHLMAYRKQLFHSTASLNEAQCIQLVNHIFHAIFFAQRLLGGTQLLSGTQTIRVVEGGSPRVISGGTTRVLSPGSQLVRQVSNVALTNSPRQGPALVRDTLNGTHVVRDFSMQMGRSL